MAPRKYQPVLSSNDSDALDPVAATMDVLILESDAHRVLSQLPSGTIRFDKLQATAEELAEEKRIKAERRRASNLARGSADVDGSYDIPMHVEPRHQFQAPADGTVRKDN